MAYGNSNTLVILWYLAIIIHGLCFGFFFIAGQIYVEKVAPKAIQASAQGFIALITFGVGSALGAKFSGVIVDLFTLESGHNWTNIWLVPAVISLAVGILFFLFFKVKPAEISVEEEDEIPIVAPAE